MKEKMQQPIHVNRLLLFISIVLGYTQFVFEKKFNIGLNLWNDIDHIKRIFIWMFYFISQLGTPLLVMIIGNGLLSIDIENIGIEKYYKKIFIPFLAIAEMWIIIHHIVWCLCNHMLFYSRDLIFEMLFIRNDANPNNWVLLPIIGLGMLLPAIKYFCDKTPRNILFGIGLVYLFAIFWVPNLNMIYNIWGLNYFYNPQWSQMIFLSPVAIYFIGGYILNNFHLLGQVKTVYLLLCSGVLFCLTVGIQIYSYINGFEYEITYGFAGILGISLCIWEVVKRYKENNLVISKIEKMIPAYGICLNIWLAGFPIVNICEKITNKFFGGLSVTYLVAYIAFIIVWKISEKELEKWYVQSKFKYMNLDEKINYGLEKIFLAALGIYIFREVLCSSLIDEIPGWSAILYSVKHVALALAVIKIYIDISIGKYDKKEILIKGVITALLFWGTFYSKNTDLYTVWIMIMAAKDIDFSKICEMSFKILAAVCLVVIATCLLGITEDLLMIRANGTVRRCFGFKFPTIIANNFMHLMIMYIYYKKEQFDYRKGIIFLIINGILFYYTDTKSAFLMGIVVLIVTLVLKYKETTLRRNLLLKKYFAIILPVSALSIVVATYMYDRTQQFWLLLNHLVTGRLGLGKEAFRSYGISMWGNEIRWITIDPRVIQTEQYNYVDSSFVQMIVNFGVIAFIIFVLLGIYIMSKAIHKHDIWCEFLFTIIILHSILDPQYFWLYLNVFLFYSCAEIKEKTV